MKTSKRSLITAIAVLCVCALSLSAASFAWFTSVTQAQVNDLNLTVTSVSDLKIAINSKATEQANIESTMWGTAFDGSAVDELWDSYSETDVINDATYKDSAMKIPATREGIKAEDGVYTGEFVAAKAQEGQYDYMEFTVYFRTMKPETVTFTCANGFKINSGSANLMPALTLQIGEEKYTGNTAFNGTIGSTSTKVTAATGAEYYVTSAVFRVYVDGENAATINKNAGVNFVLENINFNIAAA